MRQYHWNYFNMKVGYIRVSTADQNPARQEEALRQHGVERVFEEKISGKDMNRPKLKELLDFMREGDTVIVESYSRLARSTKDLLFIIDKLFRLFEREHRYDNTTGQAHAHNLRRAFPV